MQNDLQKLYTGGTVFHAFLGESIDDPEICKKLVRKIAGKYEIQIVHYQATCASFKRSYATSAR